MSNPNEYGQSHGVLTRAAGMVTDAKADFLGISTRLSGQIDGMKSQWGGQGATAFFNLHQTWTEKQRTIVNALDDFANSLTSTEKTNTTTDDAQSDAMASLAKQLGDH